MATRVSSSLLPTNVTDAAFRANIQFIEDTLVTTGGWFNTADTGQTAIGSFVHPTLQNTKMGYRVYRMNDSLQATAPIFMRLDFGATNQGVNVFGFWPTIGTGSDGAGNITGKMWDGGASVQPPVGPTSSGGAIANNSYGSAAPGRVALGMFVQGTPNFILVFCIERTKNSLGADTGDGLLVLYCDGINISNSLDRSRYLNWAPGPQPAVELGLSYVLTVNNPSQSFGGDIGAGVISHFRGVAQQPGINMLVVNAADVGAEGSFSLTLYGSTHTYQHLNSFPARKAFVGAFNADSNTRVCMRFD
jgi:hypothetical protein